MTQTDKYTCRRLAEALAAFGVNDIITSPGSRNAPLIMAVNRTKILRTLSVVDERSAAFTAVGMAEISGNPIATICTSGSAVLNYGPALAEAYYKHLPIIAVSADRPIEWIDQADSQTIRQPDSLTNIVKKSYNIKAEAELPNERRFIDRIINQAILEAITPPCGPVHINISINEPLTEEIDTTDERFTPVRVHNNMPQISTTDARLIAEHLDNKSVLIVCGVNPPSHKLSKAISTLTGLSNFVVVAEEISNIKASGVISNPDIFFNYFRDNIHGPQKPNILITFGGALVSKPLKQWLRANKFYEHWHVGVEHNLIDTFCQLTDVFHFEPELFFPRLAKAVAFQRKQRNDNVGIAQSWQKIYMDATTNRDKIINRMIANTHWNSLVAIKSILDKVPKNTNLQLSNGMTVRLAQMFNLKYLHRVDANRGVSGIDGSTSTALGASLVYKSGLTLLLTGDMSFVYDLSVLASKHIPPRLKMVVFNNGGGGIFKQIAPTRNLPELQESLHCNICVPIKNLTGTFNFEYFLATNLGELRNVLSEFINNAERPCILEIKVNADCDVCAMAELLK